MGRSVDLYSYDYKKLKNKIMEFCKTDNVDLIEKILLSYGNKIADRYILLNQELWDDYSCYYNVAHTIDKVFNVDDSFGDIFCSFNDNELGKEELISAADENEVLDELGISFEEWEE